MKFSIIEEFTIAYPKITNPYTNNKNIRNILNLYFDGYFLNDSIKDIKFEIINNNCIKLILIIFFKSKEENIFIEISENNINYQVNQEIKEKIIESELATKKDIKTFIDYIINIISLENEVYKKDKQKINLNNSQAIISKLKDDALNFVRLNIDNIGQCHVMINILSREYEYYLSNKNNLDYTIDVTNLFHWDIKYDNIIFELVMIPNIHPLMVPIINFRTIYRDTDLLIKIISQPYIIKWNIYSSVYVLIKSIVQIIKNYELLNIIDIEKIDEKENYIINALIKHKIYPETNEISLYNNLPINETIYGIDIMIKIAFDVNLSSEKYILFQKTCLKINNMYLDMLKQFDLKEIDREFLIMLYNSNQTTNELKEIIKKQL